MEQCIIISRTTPPPPPPLPPPHTHTHTHTHTDTKMGAQNQVFHHFFKFCSLVFSYIAKDDSLEHLVEVKPMKKDFKGSKLGLKSGFLPFSQGCITSFPWLCPKLLLGRKPSKRIVVQTGTEMIFSILVLPSIHSSMLVFLISIKVQSSTLPRSLLFQYVHRALIWSFMVSTFFCFDLE